MPGTLVSLPVPCALVSFVASLNFMPIFSALVLFLPSLAGESWSPGLPSKACGFWVRDSCFPSQMIAKIHAWENHVGMLAT
jgi:hypothetical protein